MAGGGQGDVLTGVIAALIGGGLLPFDAGRVAAWVAGRAAELAITRGGRSVQSLLAGDTAEWLGEAFREAQGVS
jgi:NAD(P)H-hydrate epimerase